jgi:hypothetical protein
MTNVTELPDTFTSIGDAAAGVVAGLGIIRKWDGLPVAEKCCISDMPIAAYHGPNPAIGSSISSSGLRAVFQDSPLHYWVGSHMNPHRDPEQDESSALVMGRAVHHLALGEADFNLHFVVQPETYTDAKTGTEKKWTGQATVCKEWATAQTRAILTASEFEAVRGMLGTLEWQGPHLDSGLLQNPMMKLGVLNGLIEHSLFWQDEKTGIWLRSRPDAIPMDGDDASDLKSTRSVAYNEIERAIGDRGYDLQAALVRQGMREVLGRDMKSYSLIFVQNSEPYPTLATVLREQDMDEADKDLRVAIDTFARCLEQNRWPGPAGEQSDAVFVGLNQWTRQRRIERRAYLEQEIAA